MAAYLAVTRGKSRSDAEKSWWMRMVSSTYSFIIDTGTKPVDIRVTHPPESFACKWRVRHSRRLLIVGVDFSVTYSKSLEDME